MKNVRNYLFIRKIKKKNNEKVPKEPSKYKNKKSKSVELFNSIFDENLCQNPKQDKQEKKNHKKTDNLSLTFAKQKKKSKKRKFFMIGRYTNNFCP